jgi:hypothetical protein
MSSEFDNINEKMTDEEKINSIKNVHNRFEYVTFQEFGIHEEDVEWLLEQADKSKIYKDALMNIGSNNFTSEESKIANEALFIADNLISNKQKG